ncbi:MAG: ATP-binding protein [Hyphomonadaceae bacterium]
MRRAAAEWLGGRERAHAEPGDAPRLEHLAPVLEAMPDPVLLVDADGRIAAANAPARGRWAIAGDVIRLSAVIRHPPLLDAVRATGHDGSPRSVEYVFSARSDEHFLCSIAPVSWRGVTGTLIVLRDRTEQIVAERMRSDFVANASHELRTPLSALSMLIETISGHARDNPADREKFLRMMQAQADRMSRLIDDLLSLSRIELDEHVPPSDRVDLMTVVREAADASAPIAAGRDVRIEIAGDGGAWVVGDRFQIAQVAQNLIDNAVKFSPPGGAVTVTVGLAQDREEALARSARAWDASDRLSMLAPAPAAGRSFAYLRVADSGPGIPRRFLPRLGERFFRVEREEGADRGGTGLGLAIVKHIVNRHRGGLAVETLPGVGSAFAVYFERA